MPGQYYGSGTWITWATGSSTTNVDTTWRVWHDSGTTTSLTTDPWGRWNAGTGTVLYQTPVANTYTQYVETEEAKAERLRRAEEQRVKRAAAAAKAEELLLSCLDETQAEEFKVKREFHLRGSAGRHYCIKRGRAHNVYEVDDQGRKVVEFCAHVRESIPDDDNVVAQLLMLQTDEEAYRRLANRRQLAAA